MVVPGATEIGVPRSCDELAAVDPDAAQHVLARARADYEDPWNTWNAVRTITSTAALAWLAWALRLPASRPPTAG